MKKKILTLLATIIFSGVAFVGCEKAPEAPPEPAVLYWEGDACPITGKKYADVPDNMDGELGETPLTFTHEGKNYEANVWDDKAVEEFEKNKEKYIPNIIANSK